MYGQAILPVQMEYIFQTLFHDDYSPLYQLQCLQTKAPNSYIAYTVRARYKIRGTTQIRFALTQQTLTSRIRFGQ